MKRVSLIAALSLIVLLLLPAIAADDHAVVSPDQLKWEPAPPAFPKGAQVAVLSGDPAKEGLYVVRVKVPAGYKVPPHTHPNDENVTVISGTFNIGMGGTFNDKNGSALKAGGFARPERHAALCVVHRGQHHPVARDGAAGDHVCQSGR